MSEDSGGASRAGGTGLAPGRSSDRRATDRRGELVGAGFCALMAVLFACVVIFGKQVQAGRLPFVFLAIRFAGQSVLLLGLIMILGRPLILSAASVSRWLWRGASATGPSPRSTSLR